MGKRILVLDDDAIFRATTLEALEARGHQVLAAATGTQADALLRREALDLLIVDGLLPDTNGQEWILRNRKEIGQTPIFFVSAFWRDVNTHKRLINEVGVTQVITKPVDPAALAEKVQEVLGSLGQAADEVELDDLDIAVERVPLCTDPAELLILRRDVARTLSGKIRELAEATRRARGRTELGTLVEARLRCQKLAGLAAGCGFGEIAEQATLHEADLRSIKAGASVPEHKWEGLFARVEQMLARVKQETAPQPLTERRPGRLLLVTDDPATFQHVQAMLPPRLCKVVAAATPDEAVLAARSESMQAVVLDGALGGELGAVVVAAIIRAAPGCEQTPLAFITGGDTRALVAAAREVGAKVWIPRPLARDVVLEAVCRLLKEPPPEPRRVGLWTLDKELLEELGFWTARYGMVAFRLPARKEAVGALENARADALYVDLQSPGGGGPELIQELRACPRWDELPIVACAQSPALRLAALHAGASDAVFAATPFEEQMTLLRGRMEEGAVARQRRWKDPITGLPTRRVFLEGLARRMADARRNGHTVSVVLLELLGLGELSHLRGGRAVDEVMGEAGQVIEYGIRTEDLRGTWSQNTFAAALLGAGAGNLDRILARLKETEQAGDFPHLRDLGFKLKFRTAVATFPVDGTSLLELFQLAQERLHAKQSALR